MAQHWIRTRRKAFTLTLAGAASRVLAPLLDRSRRRRDARVEARSVHRVLVLELGNIGDIVLLMPFLTELRERFSYCSVTLLARPHARDILAGTGLVDEFLSADGFLPRGSSTYNPFGYDWRRLHQVVRDVRERQFDVAFQCRMHIREHLLLRASGAYRTVGYAFGAGEPLLTDAFPRRDVDRHKTQDWLQLLSPFGGSGGAQRMRLHVTDEERVWARRFLADHGIAGSDRLVAVHPGASVAEKRWPVEHFAAVADRLARRRGPRVLAFVDPEGVGETLVRNPELIPVREDMRGMIALLDTCGLLVCNDSGPMHIAAALGVPTVAIFGPGDPRWFGPLGAGHRIVRARDGAGVSSVAVSQVLAAVDEALARADDRGRNR